MIRNAGTAGSPHEVIVDSAKEFASFDELPRELREKLNDAPIQISAATVIPHVKKFGSAAATSAIDRLIGVVLAERGIRPEHATVLRPRRVRRFRSSIRARRGPAC